MTDIRALFFQAVADTGELVVHGDDLAASLGATAPQLDPAVTGLVIATLVEIARLRHGDSAVLRALARRERDPVQALRVF